MTMNKSDELKRQSRAFLSRALALWATTGYDRVNGGYFEALSPTGDALAARDKRFRIHGRTMFAHAAGTLWNYHDGLAVAEDALEFVMHKCRMSSGGFVSATKPDGTWTDCYARTYEHAFLLLGLGWLAFATKKPAHENALEAVWNFMATSLRHADGAFVTSLAPAGSPREAGRLQNPHMHLFEALLNLYELFNKPQWLAEARALYALFGKRIYDARAGVLLEFFTDDWEKDPAKGNLIDPGHHYEWTWLLYKYASLSGEAAPMLPALYDYAHARGSDAHGLGYDEMYIDGRIYRGTHRLWVQTEALKAHLAMGALANTATEKAAFFERADATLETMFNYYLRPELGIWNDQLDANLAVISTDAPTSTLYHILVALNEYARLR